MLTVNEIKLDAAKAFFVQQDVQSIRTTTEPRHSCLFGTNGYLVKPKKAKTADFFN